MFNEEQEFFVANLLVRNHFIMVMIRWFGLAPGDHLLLLPIQLPAGDACLSLYIKVYSICDSGWDHLTPPLSIQLPAGDACLTRRGFVIDNLLVRNHFDILIIRWTGLASWDHRIPFLQIQLPEGGCKALDGPALGKRASRVPWLSQRCKSNENGPLEWRVASYAPRERVRI